MTASKKTTDGIIKLVLGGGPQLSSAAMSLIQSELHGLTDVQIEFFKHASAPEVLRGVHFDIQRHAPIIPTYTIAAIASVIWRWETLLDSNGNLLPIQSMLDLSQTAYEGIGFWSRNGLGVLTFNDLAVGIDIARLRMAKGIDKN